jgi:LPXTG-site transpeptidase (sortase) family protein
VVAIRKVLFAGVVGAAVIMAASITLPNAASDDRDQAIHKQASLSSQASPAPAATAGSTRIHRTSGSSPVRSGASSPASASRVQPDPEVPLPAQAISFTLAVTASSGPILANVGSISVASNQPVDPPHSTAAEWNTAVWVQQSAYPSAQSAGTSYIYGHACHHHRCPFTRLKDARVGDLVRVTLPTGVLTYQIAQTGLSPKSASALPRWASDSTEPNRIVLVTCAFEQGDTSTNNIVVVASMP